MSDWIPREGSKPFFPQSPSDSKTITLSTNWMNLVVTLAIISCRSRTKRISHFFVDRKISQINHKVFGWIFGTEMSLLRSQGDNLLMFVYMFSFKAQTEQKVSLNSMVFTLVVGSPHFGVVIPSLKKDNVDGRSPANHHLGWC